MPRYQTLEVFQQQLHIVHTTPHLATSRNTSRLVTLKMLKGKWKALDSRHLYTAAWPAAVYYSKWHTDRQWH